MHRHFEFTMIFLLLASLPSVHADSIILQTEVYLTADEEFRAIVGVGDGPLNLTVSSSVGTLNLSLVQENKTLLSINTSSSSGPQSEVIEIESGEVAIRGFFPSFFLGESTVTISITQDKQSIDGLLLGGGLLLILLLPFVYLLGRRQG